MGTACQVELHTECGFGQQHGIRAALAQIERQAAEKRPESSGPRAPKAVQVEGSPITAMLPRYRLVVVHMFPVAPDQQHRHHVAAYTHREEAGAHRDHRHRKGERRAAALVTQRQRAPRLFRRDLGRAVVAVPGHAGGLPKKMRAGAPQAAIANALDRIHSLASTTQSAGH